jgi:hypothetical protein
MNFKEWLLLESARGTYGKQQLYPSYYSQTFNYCPSDVITWSADAFTYMPSEDKVFKMNWGKGILSNPNPWEKNKECFSTPPPNITGKFKMLYGSGILSRSYN